MNKILGLELPSTSGVGFLFSNNIINLSGSPSIYFRLNNIGIRNRDSRGKTDGTIQKINVNCNFGEFIFYESLENIYYPLSNRTITQLDITLTDSDNNELFLNGAEFSCTLTIHFQKIRENVIPQKYLLDMISRLENNQNDESENKK
jgi:hypothetical protein